MGVAEETREELSEKLDELIETKQDLTNVSKDRVATKRVPKNKYNYFVILKDTSDIEIPYYVLRTQEKSINSRIASLKKEYKKIKEVFRIYTPNATKLWISICDKYFANIEKSKTANWFALKDISELQFKNNIISMDQTERKNHKFI